MLKLKPGSIVYARSIDGDTMADKQLLSTTLVHVLSRNKLVLTNVYPRLALTLYVAQAMGFTWTAEVPSSCLMDEHQRWQRLGSATKVFRVSFWVRGSQHLRKIRLYSNSKAIVIHRPVAGTKRSSIYAKKRKPLCFQYRDKPTIEPVVQCFAWF